MLGAGPDQTLVELALVSIATEIMIAFDFIIMATTFFEGYFFPSK